MANQGKRMVKENLIAQIGQGGGGGTPIQAGTGIDITGTTTKTISVDNTVAMKTDIPTYTAGNDIDITDGVISVDGDFASEDQIINTPRYSFTTLPYVVLAEAGKTIEDWIALIPILKTALFTDEDTFGHPVINLEAWNYDNKQMLFTGFFGIRDTANNATQYFATCNANVTTSSTSASFKPFLIERNGDNDYLVNKARWNGEFNLVGTGENVYNFKRFTNADFQQIAVAVTGVFRNTFELRVNNPKVNKNYPSTTPDQYGKYALTCSVNNVGTVEWVQWKETAEMPDVAGNYILTINNDGQGGTVPFWADGSMYLLPNSYPSGQTNKSYTLKYVFDSEGNGRIQWVLDQE